MNRYEFRHVIRSRMRFILSNRLFKLVRIPHAVTICLMMGSFVGGALLMYTLAPDKSAGPLSQMALLMGKPPDASSAQEYSSGEQIMRAISFGESLDRSFQKGESTLPAGIFEALEGAEQPLLRHLGPPDILAMQTDVPMPMNRLVQSVMGYLLEHPEDHIYRWLERSATYFPMIETIFAKEGVPDELKYLALVESGLQTRANSWAGAAGIWQFMPATGSAYGLDITDYVDERLDPVKATRAAARHLRDLYYLFDGDWLLALSGYNCSPTVIRAAINHVEQSLNRDATFWDIYPYIPRETRAYVPTFIAAALIMSNPAAFDLDRVLPGPRYAFDYVPAQGGQSLSAVAEFAGASVARLRALNPELLQKELPPGPLPYYVRIPYGSYETFLSASAAEHAVADEFLADAAPMRVRYGSRTLRPIAGTAPYDSPHAGQPLRFYLVRSGDTLYGIAAQYDVSVSQLMLWNNMGTGALQPGDRLKIYG